MAFVVLFSTMSFTISEHYCGGDLVDVAMFFEADSCEMEMDMPSSTEDCNFEKEDCCKDINKIVEGQNGLNIQVVNLDFEQQLFIASFIYSYINLFEGLDKNIVPFKNYSPPLIVTDIQVLDQVFLI
ncbi:hypothetical protein HGB55_12710 [Lutibacter sp. B1]|nr:hypothetical protein [Lutibacter sp. B1]